MDEDKKEITIKLSNPLDIVNDKKTFICIGAWTLLKIATTKGCIDYETSEVIETFIFGGGLASLKHSWDKKTQKII